MRRYSFLLMCLFLLVLVKADEDKNTDCRGENAIDFKLGESLTLVSHVDPLKRCYFVFTDDDSSDQCCFNRKENNEDCDTSDKYKSRNSTKCPEYVLAVDSIEAKTCVLTITSVSENAAGQYKSFDAEDVPIQGCHVTVSAEVQSSGGRTGAIVGFVVAAALFVSGIAGITIFVILRKKRDLPKIKDKDKDSGGEQDQALKTDTV